MTTPTGTISLNDVQTEFGGVNPIGINEYYRGGLYTTTNNTGVPTSGQISMSQLRGLYRTSSPAELSAALASTPYADYRNKLFSYLWANFGFESSSATAYHQIGDNNRYVTSLTANFTYPSSYVTGAQVFLKTSYITFVCITAAYGASYSSLSVGGVARTMTSIAGVSGQANPSYMNYTQVAVGENALAGLTASATFTKSAVNAGNLFNVMALPGRWNLIGTFARNYTTGTGTLTAISGVQTNDLLIATTSRSLDASINAQGTVSGVTVTEIARRSSQWYNAHNSLVARVTSSGSLTYNPGNFTTTSGGDQRITTQHFNAGIGAVFRCIQG